jgi:hypothetical protein
MYLKQSDVAGRIGKGFRGGKEPEKRGIPITEHPSIFFHHGGKRGIPKGNRHPSNLYMFFHAFFYTRSRAQVKVPRRAGTLRGDARF